MRRAIDGRTAALAAAAFAAGCLVTRLSQPAAAPESDLARPGEYGARASAAGAAGAPENGGETPAQAAGEDYHDALADAPRVPGSTARRAPPPRSTGLGRGQPPAAGSSRLAVTGAHAERSAAGSRRSRGRDEDSRPDRAAPAAARRAAPARGAAQALDAPRPEARAAAAPRARRDAGSPRAPELRTQTPPARRSAVLAARGGGGFRASSGRRASLFDAPAGRSPSAARQRERGPLRGRRFHPILLSKLLGPRPLKPPPASLAPPPALAALDALRPARDARGAAVPVEPAELSAVEDVDPAALGRDRRAGAHWDADQWHAGAARGLVRGKGWTWLYRDGARWWALAGRGPTAVLRHDGAWWTKERGVWFLLHDGEPWAWRSFHDWDAQGLFQPGSGTEMVYSKDLKRVAVVAPGEGAEVFDARSGAVLDRIPESEMPPRRRPKLPSSLDLPSDVFAN